MLRPLISSQFTTIASDALKPPFNTNEVITQNAHDGWQFRRGIVGPCQLQTLLRPQWEYVDIFMGLREHQLSPSEASMGKWRYPTDTGAFHYKLAVSNGYWHLSLQTGGIQRILAPLITNWRYPTDTGASHSQLAVSNCMIMAPLIPNWLYPTDTRTSHSKLAVSNWY